MSEEEYAIKYAEERRMRMALETRLMGLMYALIPYSGHSFGLAFGILEMDKKTIPDAMQGVVQWQGDIETNVLLNLFKPAGKFKGVAAKDLVNCRCMEDLPEKELTRMEMVAKHHAKETGKQWDKLAAEHGYASQEEFSGSHREQVAEIIMKGMMNRPAKGHG